MIVLDTNVVSYIFSKDDRAKYYLEAISGKRAVISFQTFEELWFGAYKAEWGERRKNELTLFLEALEIIWPNPELVDICARLRSERGRLGGKLASADAWIAATAVLLECPLASQDRDFSEIRGLEVVKAP